jgi:hypothetical protein
MNRPEGTTVPLDLDAIEARATAATEGPWEATGVVHPNNEAVGLAFVQSHTGWPATCFRSADSVFIAHSREDVPALVAEVRRLRAILEDASDESVGPW